MHHHTTPRRRAARLGTVLAAVLLAGGLAVSPSPVVPAAAANDVARESAAENTVQTDSTTVVSSTFEEAGTAPWAPRGGASVTVSTLQAHGGAGSMLVSGRTSNWHGAETPIVGTLVPGQTYTVTAWVRLVDGTAPTDVIVTAGENNADYVRVAAVAASDTSWVQLTGTYAVGSGVTSGSLYFEAAAADASFYVDDVVITGADPGGNGGNDGGDGADTGNTGTCPAAQATTKPTGLDGSESLHQSLPFPLGAAVSSYAVTEERARDTLNQNFNQVTPENYMKVEAWYTGPWQFTTDNTEANALMDWGAQSGNRVYGHVLVWHSQTPDWFFQDAEGSLLTSSPEDRAVARERMRTHINNVAKYLYDRYGAFGSATNPLVAFDVVNEVVSDGAGTDSGGLRTSYWYQILGEEYIDLAFRYADEAFNSTYAAEGTGRPVTLFINEYNTENGTGPGTKTDRYHALVERLLARGVPVDGVGHQFHTSLSANVGNLAAAMDYFDDLPVVQAVTEMDVPTGSPVTEDLLRRQGHFFRSAFDAFRAQQADNGNLFSVTLWGIADYRSWRTCSGAPLAFDNDYDGKWAYIGILGRDVPRESQTLSVFGAPDAADPDTGTWALMNPTPISEQASFQARWGADGVTVSIVVTDATADARDSVTLSTADGAWTIRRGGGASAGLTRVRVSQDGFGWSVVATLPMTGLSEGTVIPFEVSVTDDETSSGWNGAGALGSLTLVEDLSATTARWTAGAPTIDGDVDAVWQDATTILTGKQIEGTDGAGATVRTLWSGDETASTLYVLYEVIDATPDVSSSEVHEQDSVELFLDLGNAKAGAYTAGDMQLRVNADNVQSFGAGSVGEQQARVTSAVRRHEGGYTVEVAVSLLDQGGAGTVHGFDTQVNDGVAGKRESVRIWADPTGSSWRSTARWGVIRLLPAPSPEPSAAPSVTPAAQPGEVAAASSSASASGSGGSLAGTGAGMDLLAVAVMLLVGGGALARHRRRV